MGVPKEGGIQAGGLLPSRGGDAGTQLGPDAATD